MIIGVMRKSDSKTVYIYANHRYKTFPQYKLAEYIQYEVMDGTDYRAYSYDGSQIVFDDSYIEPPMAGNFPKIYKYISNQEFKDNRVSPVEHSYTTGLDTSLYPKRVFVKGELVNVEWYSDKECTDLVLKVDIVYTRDALGFATDRVTTRVWLNEDETENEKKKITNKDYTINSLDQIKEGIRRRGNIVEGLQKPTLEFMVYTIMSTPGNTLSQAEILQLGRDFLKSHKLELQAFADESHKQIITDLTSATDFWLDNVIAQDGTTIRAYILNELDI